MDNLTTKEAAALLRRQDNILILTHGRPDGDTIGCAAGLCAALRQMGKTAYLLYNPEITANNEGYAAAYWAPEGFAPDFVVSVDVPDEKLLFPAAREYLPRIGLAVDHHPHGDGRIGFGEHGCLDASRAACGEIVYEICRELGERKEKREFFAALKSLLRDAMMQAAGQTEYVRSESPVWPLGAAIASLELVGEAEKQIQFNANFASCLYALALGIKEEKEKWQR